MTQADERSESRGACPERDVLRGFSLGALPQRAQDAIARHVAECPRCLVALESFDDGDDELIAMLRQEEPMDGPGVTDHACANGATTTAGGTPPPTELAPDQMTAPDGRYRVLRAHERGGIGQVSVARDGQLDREVAYKALQDRHADDPHCRSRFLREAQVTGGLEHRGIVPVYSLALDADGRLFYTMRLIRGVSLKEAVQRCRKGVDLGEAIGRPGGDDRSGRSPGLTARDLRELLKRFQDVCEVVSYAHDRDVLHLDLKPTNIMLGPYGETFVVDWGQAERIGRPEPPEGPPPGTPGYRSPEQAAGRYDLLSPASDVYSLGVTLSYILTGRSPSRDEGAPRDTVGRGDLPPSVDLPSDPRALEAVARKAMQEQPGARYPSPRALVEEIDRWLSDEPVSAWREPRTLKARRWLARHRSATLASLLVLATIAVAAIVTTGVVSLARAGERRALARAESRADLAIEAVRKFREAVDDNLDVRNRPDLDGLRKKLLAEPLRFFERLREELQADRDAGPATSVKLARATLELANLTAAIDSQPNALRAYQEAVALLGPLEVLGAPPGDPNVHDARLLLVEALSRLGLLQRDLGKVAEARASLRRALAGSERLADEYPAPSMQIALARVLDRVGLLEAADDPGTASSMLERAAALLRPLARHDGVIPDDPDALAQICNHLGSVLSAQGRHPEAAARFREAIATLEALVRESPGDHLFRSNLASTYHNLANLQLTGGVGGDAREGFERARDLWEGLVRESPSSATYRASLVRDYGNLGVLHDQVGEIEQAKAALDRAREISEGLVRDHPTVLPYRTILGKTYINLGVLEDKAGRSGRVVDLLGPARDHLREVHHARPGDLSAREALATACRNLAIALDGLGRHAEALDGYRECADLQLELARADDPRIRPNRGLLVAGLLGMARCHLHLGHVAKAIDAAETMRKVWAGDPQELIEIAVELTLCSEAAASDGEARQYADRAMDLLREAVASGFRNPELLECEPIFAPLRKRPDFRDLVTDAAFPADPFAR